MIDKKKSTVIKINFNKKMNYNPETFYHMLCDEIDLHLSDKDFIYSIIYKSLQNVLLTQKKTMLEMANYVLESARDCDKIKANEYTEIELIYNTYRAKFFQTYICNCIAVVEKK